MGRHAVLNSSFPVNRFEGRQTAQWQCSSSAQGAVQRQRQQQHEEQVTWEALGGAVDASGGASGGVPAGGSGLSLLLPCCCCPEEEASMRLSNCGVFTMMISIFAFCTGLSRPASSVVSRPVVISARSTTPGEPSCPLLCMLSHLPSTPHAACAISAHQYGSNSPHLCDKP